MLIFRVQEFAESMLFLYTKPEEGDKLGLNGKSRVEDMFTQARFTSKLSEILQL